MRRQHKKTDIEKLMDGVLADLWITDPPYNVGYEGKTKDALKIKNDKMDDETFLKFLDEAFCAATEYIKSGASFYIWHADSKGYEFRKACKDCNLEVKQCLIWNKQTLVMGRQDYQWKHEPCLYGWKAGSSHSWYSDRKQTTVLNFDKPVKSDLHPTMKPVASFEYQICNSSKGGDIILDTFGGSGTTLIACEKNNRNARIVELDPHYCDVIVDRYKSWCQENNREYSITLNGKLI